MNDSWLQIPLSDYQSHMSDVLQLEALSHLFGGALERRRPRSVAILGIAGGNGLERIDPAITTRVVGLDLNLSYHPERWPRACYQARRNIDVLSMVENHGRHGSCGGRIRRDHEPARHQALRQDFHDVNAILTL